MKVPLSWLAQYVDLTLPVEQLAHRLSMAGAEVAAIERSGAHWDQIAVGRVVTVEPHPNADRLVLVTVDIADGESHRVVCGAPNVAEGQTIAFASAGAMVCDAHAETDELVQLKKAKIRGVESSGMVCSERELGLSDEHEGILVLDSGLEPGTPLADAIGETVFDITPTPNRPDHLSVLGIAREVAALTGRTVREPERTYTASGPDVADQLSVRIDVPELCPRFVAGVVQGITIRPSPDWMQAALIAAGQRPINNVVDVTNYVMLEFGQPLHTFNYDAVRGGELIIRLAEPGETLPLLDGTRLELTDQHLLVADAEGPSSLAGVMGGEASEVRPDTTSVLLEAANWHGPQIRREMTALKLRTDAGARFEKGLNPELALVAWERAMRLLLETAGGTASAGVVDVYPGLSPAKTVHLTRSRLEQILALDVPVEQVRTVLESLGFGARWVPPEKYVVTVPYWRTDIDVPDDLVEEVGRIIGYDSLPSAPLAGSIPERVVSPLLSTRERVRDAMAAAGLTEVINYATSSEPFVEQVQPLSTLTDRPLLALINPMSAERGAMRPSLRSGLLESYAANARHESGPLGLFELGKVFLPQNGDLPRERTMLVVAIGGQTAVSLHSGSTSADTRALDLFDAKAVAEAIAAALRIEFGYRHAADIDDGADPALVLGSTARIELGGQAVGVLGQLDPAIADRFGIDAVLFLLELEIDTLADLAAEPLAIGSLSRYPAVTEDLAIVVDREVAAATVGAIVQRPRLVESASLFDVYEGDQVPEGKRSLAFAVRYRAADRTLTEKDVGKARAGIVKQLARELGASLRGE